MREKTMAKRQAANPSPAPKRLMGYARVSTDDQVHDAQNFGGAGGGIQFQLLDRLDEGWADAIPLQ